MYVFMYVSFRSGNRLREAESFNSTSYGLIRVRAKIKIYMTTKNSLLPYYLLRSVIKPTFIECVHHVPDNIIDS